MKKMHENLRKLVYNTVLCQAFSPDGNYLTAGNIYGDVSVYEISKILGSRQSVDENVLQGPSYNFVAHSNQRVESMATTDNFLVTGSSGVISGWDWKNVTSSKASKAKLSWSVQLPEKKDYYGKPDVNYILYSKKTNLLYVACENVIYLINLENGSIKQTLEGHSDFIHSISLSNNVLASSAEDGTVRLWDVRKKEATNILQPHLVDKVARPNLGKWIGAIDFTDDWLLCGGGPKLSLWSMRTMEACTIFDLPDQGIHVAEIYEERISAGGAMPNVYHLNYQGETLSKIPISCNTVYSIVHCEKPQEVLSICGTSNNLDICTNFNYREMVVKFM